jgi:hypothetical protein
MKPLAAADVLDLTAYEKNREAFRARIIELKRPRRVALGPELTFVFENRDTVLFQIQEMLRAERIVDDRKVQAEIDVYNDLVPGTDELSATLLIEIEDRARVRPTLDRLIGIDEHVHLDVGNESVRATFDPKQFEAERIAAVQYVKFRLGKALAAKFQDPRATVTLRVEHPNYRAAASLDGATRESLSADLRGES